MQADAGYLGAPQREKVRLADPAAPASTGKLPAAQVHQSPSHGEKENELAIEPQKASVGVCVEHPFHILKNLFHHRRTRYRGLAKHQHQLQVLFGRVNLVIAARKLP